MDNFLKSDLAARAQALDARHSFIVQAPAGSGKTELLIQRFLVLLNHVQSPEEILAITFTKKSANEMRVRIINTLNHAVQTNTPPQKAHEKQTWELAKKVLHRDNELKWNLLSNPNRLRIQTIDAFNASLTKRMPILSQFGSAPEIADQSEFLYLEAVQEFLSHIEENVEWTDAIAQLLLHMDNDLNKVQQLLIDMLAKRDQWLRHILLGIPDKELRIKLEHYLKHVVEDTLTRLVTVFPQQESHELLDLIQFASETLIAEKSDSKIQWAAGLKQLPGNKNSDLNAWLGITEFLLTKSHTWRKSFTIKEGFPAPGKDNRLKEIKNRAIALITQLHDREDIRIILEELRYLPTHHYPNPQWNILQALHLVLHVVVAQLKLIFQKYGKIDYIENAQAALTALGTDDEPTDIALALDYRIQHILVDEFQDTADTQYRLLKRLTAGWQGDDGRTLFIVGDPMQSIYRFREAEVGLFIRARKKGIGHIPLIPLTLAVNFRSTPGVVSWVNEHFKKVLPVYEDIATGAVSYSESIANQPLQITENEPAVELHPCLNPDAFAEQAEQIIKIIKEIKEKTPTEKIAILVRTRTHLKSIIPALKKSLLPFRAINIDPLSLRPTIQDLMSLTRALIHTSDRIAWLAILRAPWCGLSLSDLLTLTNHDPNTPIWKQLQNNELILKLSEDGQQRLARVLPILKSKIYERRRYSLRLWIESTWILLGGPACVEQLTDLDDAFAYFNLLERFDNSGDLSHFESLDEVVKELFAAADHQADDTLQIMTVHNAKGLEFDTVILPHLERKPSNDDAQLLLWMERPRENDSSELIISPINAIGEKNDSIYEYLKRQIKEKSKYENGRLLYVAATRAKRKLHILFSVEAPKKGEDTEIKAPANSLLEQLWPAIVNTCPIQKETSSIETLISTETNQDTLIRRLPHNWENGTQEYHPTQFSPFYQSFSGFSLPSQKPKIIGTFFHQLLQQFSQKGIQWWTTQDDQKKNTYIKNHLTQLGLLNADLSSSADIINSGINNLLNDPKGKWIIHSHQEAQSEFPLTAVINGEIKSLIMDRTFIDEKGTRWIIDYKTSILTSQDLETFLSDKQKEYEKQLKEYYLALREIDHRPIRVGLYFPLIPAWKEWSFD